MIIVTFTDKSEAVLEDGLVQYEEQVLPGTVCRKDGVWWAGNEPVAVIAAGAVRYLVNRYRATEQRPAVNIKAVR